MHNRGINIRFLPSILLLMMMIINYSCVQSISEPENDSIQILDTSVELDRFENELFFQVETNQSESQELIQNVSVELTYTGDDIHEYSETFQLYDNGTNGDLISSNGIFTLLASADTVDLPAIEPTIIDIDIPSHFQLHKTEEDSMDISLTIYGKGFMVKSEVLDDLNMITTVSKTVNLDNSDIEIYVNNDSLYIDRTDEDNICIREPASSPNSTNFWLYNTLRYGIPSNNHANQFDFNSKVRFKSVNNCGGYGKVYFRFKLIDWDTGANTTTSDIEIIIYGCGDGNCTPELEDSDKCPEDCQ